MPVDIVGEIIRFIEGLEVEGLMKLVVIAGVLVFLLAALTAIERNLRRLITIGAIDRASAGKMYRISEASLTVFALLLILYVVTGDKMILGATIALSILVMASAWDVAANALSYFALMLSRSVSKGDYIILENGAEGRIREIALLHTTLESPHGVYIVPNVQLIRRGKLQVREPVYVKLVVRVWGLPGVEAVEKVQATIKEVIEARSELFLLHTESVRMVIDRVTSDGLVVEAHLPLPGPRPNLARLNEMMIDLASSLKELRCSYSISLEAPEGYELRWRRVA